jgi:hypothetical protein
MAAGMEQDKWITVERLIQVLSQLDPRTIVLPNDHHNLSLYEPEGFPERYIGIIDVRTKQIVIR